MGPPIFRWRITLFGRSILFFTLSKPKQAVHTRTRRTKDIFNKKRDKLKKEKVNCASSIDKKILLLCMMVSLVIVIILTILNGMGKIS